MSGSPIPARSSLFKNATTQNKVRANNFPMVVTEYNVKATPPYMIGYRLDNDADVKICLRDVANINKGTHKRPEISDFAKKRDFRNDPGVTPGGVVYVIEPEPVPGQDDLFSARWIQALSHTQEEAEIVLCTAHFQEPRLGKEKVVNGVTVPGSAYSLATLLFDFPVESISEKTAELIGYTKPFKVDSIDDLKIELLKLFEKSPLVAAGIRIKVGDAYDCANLYQKVGHSPDKLVEDFLKNTIDDDMRKVIEHQDSLIEVIPYCNVFMGSKSAAEQHLKISTADALNKTSPLKIEASRYQDITGEKPTPLFGNSVVAMRLRENDDGTFGIYFTAVKPLFTSKKDTYAGIGNALASTETAYFSPPKLLNANQKVDAEAQAEAEAQAQAEAAAEAKAQAEAEAAAEAQAQEQAEAEAKAQALEEQKAQSSTVSDMQKNSDSEQSNTLPANRGRRFLRENRPQ